MFIYSDTEVNTGTYRHNPNADANSQYAKHLENYFYLRFILMNSDDFKEKAQANKELSICQRKLDFWRRHGNFCDAVAQRDTEETKKKWRM
jgi:hypothetical protein